MSQISSKFNSSKIDVCIFNLMVQKGEKRKRKQGHIEVLQIYIRTGTLLNLRKWHMGRFMTLIKKPLASHFLHFVTCNFILPFLRFYPSWISLSRFICFLACWSKLFKTRLSLLREFPPCFPSQRFQCNHHRAQPLMEPLLQHLSADCHLLTWASWIQTCHASYWNWIY